MNIQQAVSNLKNGSSAAYRKCWKRKSPISKYIKLEDGDFLVMSLTGSKYMYRYHPEVKDLLATDWAVSEEKYGRPRKNG